jgi:glycosyltransferase involved in cell wall biosynthesis
VVSVVTSVYNGARYLAESLEGVLAQDGPPFEVVVVDDGSTDGSSALLDSISARDPRVRVLRQANAGLTAALVRACSEARGALLARHDSDDVSYPGRIAALSRALLDDPALSMVSSWGRGIGPLGETLYEIHDAAQDREGPPIQGVWHGSVMFRADAYRRVGGYRTAFRYAQDIDLWLRLAEVGGVSRVPAVLYGYRFWEESISAARRRQQEALRELAYASRAARRAGESEAPILARAEAVSAESPIGPKRRRAEASYFIARCLLDRRDAGAVPYFWRSVKDAPWRLQGWAGLLASRVLCRRRAA